MAWTCPLSTPWHHQQRSNCPARSRTVGLLWVMDWLISIVHHSHNWRHGGTGATVWQCALMVTGAWKCHRGTMTYLIYDSVAGSSFCFVILYINCLRKGNFSHGQFGHPYSTPLLSILVMPNTGLVCIFSCHWVDVVGPMGLDPTIYQKERQVLHSFGHPAWDG